MRLRVASGEWLLRLLGATWRVEFAGEAALERARRASPSGNVAFAFWHSSLLVLAATHQRRGIQVLVSQHRDGEWIARILERLGYGLVRGSSRRGGTEALFRMATLLEGGADVAVTVDGPIGPRYRVHPGVALAARRAGRPIVPVVVDAARRWRLSTWDALQVPQPGSGVRVEYLEALAVPPGLPAAPAAALQAELETRLQAATIAAEARHARPLVCEDVQDRRSYFERTSEAERPPRLLAALARLYGAGVRCERALRPRPPGRASYPWVVGVGNLEAGGTGKTPCVVALARAIAGRGQRVALLTRGHTGSLGRERPALYAPAAAAQAADETRLLAAHVGDAVPIVVSRDKRAGLEWLRGALQVDVVLVDDALQTRNLPVDRHLVLLDWERPLGNGHLLPAGRLREAPEALGRAAALLFTRARADAPPADRRWTSLPAPRFVAREEFAGLRRLGGEAVDPAALRGAGVALLSGLGRPQAFEHLVREVSARHGIDVRRAVRVGDHAPFERELRRLVPKLPGLGCQHILLTAKDALRLPPGSQWDEPLLVVEQRLVVRDLNRLLESLLPR